MKYSKTTLRELSAKYRSILKKCFLLNAMAMGLIVATNASAATDVTYAGKYNGGVDNVSTAPSGTTYSYVNTAGDDVTDVPYTTAPTGITYKDSTNVSIAFDADNIPVASDYSVTTTADGTNVRLVDGTNLYAGVTTSASNYEFSMKDADGNATFVSSDTVLEALTKEFTSEYITAENAVTVTSGSTAPITLDISNYKKESGGVLNELKYDSLTDTYSLEAEGIDVSAENAALLTVLKTKYEEDTVAVNALQTTLNDYADYNSGNKDAISGVVTADQANIDTQSGYFATVATAQGLYDTAIENQQAATDAYNTKKDAYDEAVAYYNTPIMTSIEDGANNAITEALADSGAVKTAIDNAVATLATGAVQDNADAIDLLNNDAETAGSVAYAVKQLADGAVATNTSAIATLNGDADTSGSVAYAIAQEASARDTAIASATTMGTTAGKNYAADSSVIAAIKSIDTNMGKIHGLIGSDGSFNGTATSTNMDGTTYKGNLAVGTTVEDHLVALDNTIGIMSNLTTTEKTTVVGAINEVDGKIGTTTDGTYVAAANTVGQNLNALDSALGDVRSDMASTQAANNARFAQIDRRIDKLEDKMEKGLAANNALAGLVPLDHTHKTQLSAAMGGYGSNQALAVGAFHYINDSTLLNAGVGYGGNSSLSYKVGVTFGF